MELAKVLENVCKFFFGGKYLQFLNEQLITSIKYYYCRCESGWSGELCDICETLPSCKYGTCQNDKPLTCKCDEGWLGPNCDCPKCSEGCDLEHGFCIQVRLETYIFSP